MVSSVGQSEDETVTEAHRERIANFLAVPLAVEKVGSALATTGDKLTSSRSPYSAHCYALMAFCTTSPSFPCARVSPSIV